MNHPLRAHAFSHFLSSPSQCLFLFLIIIIISRTTNVFSFWKEICFFFCITLNHHFFFFSTSISHCLTPTYLSRIISFEYGLRFLRLITISLFSLLARHESISQLFIYFSLDSPRKKPHTKSTKKIARPIDIFFLTL
ncbi:hypothetical protein Pst134EB_029949 [Puccinia striiformis f. sp. tritici]|nr:hypothetical protein Pst134EB_029949 [Puccinia striiformis f. sp. tritici]